MTNKCWLTIFRAETLDEALEVPFGLMGNSDVRGLLHQHMSWTGKDPDIQPGYRLTEHAILADKRTVVMPTPWVVVRVIHCPASPDDPEFAGTVIAQCRLQRLSVEEWEKSLQEI